VILGNHDGNLRNSSRQDALTPIVKALEHPTLHLLRNAGETRLEGNFTLNVLSVFDEDNWQQPTDKNRINISLYHGSISRCQTDLGWTMERGENDISIFDNFDYGFLGDIHKTNQILDEKGKIRYPGSTVQQNHGETNDKGYLLWDIKDKENFTCEHFVLCNPKPFITIRLTRAGRMPKNIDIPKGARVRLLSENHLPLDTIRRAIDIAKTRFKPEAITYLNRSSGQRIDIEELTKSLIKEDLRDITVQEDLIGKYLQEYQADKKTVEKIFAINRVYKTKVEEEEEISRNVNWRLKKVEWDNLFNYGEKNSIEFENLNGIVGIFGKNFSGKSSIIDSLLYALFNTTSKNNRKNLNIINQNRNYCRGYVEIDVAEKTYKIERISTKYQKKLHGNVTMEAKTDLNFSVYDNAICEEESLNGTSRNETDKNIKKIFGSLEDFLLTSMASQLGSLSYIGEGSTRRKEILAKFLDLEVFERKYRMAKEDASDAKALLKRDESRIFDEELAEAQLKYNENEIHLTLKEEECQGLKVELEQRQESLREITENLRELPDEVVDIVHVINNIKDLKDKLESCENLEKDISNQMGDKEEYMAMTEKFLNNLNIEEAKEKQKEIEDKTLELRSFEEEIEKLLEELERKNKKTSLLDEVPCGDKFPKCKFIQDAHTAKKGIKPTKVGIDNLKIDKSNISNNIEKLNPNEVSKHVQEYENLWQKLTEAKNGLNLIQLELEKNKNEIFKTKNDLSELERQEEYYDENKDLIENYDKLCTRQKNIQLEVAKMSTHYEKCQKEILELYKENGSLEERTEKISRDKEEYLALQDNFSAYDLYMRCMHSNGISYDIIKKRLPLINSEVSKVLANIVDFEIFFENDDNRLDILIKHPGYEPRPIEMGSGAEKTIAAMAIRLALLNVSTLPKGDIFVLDEPGTSLDEDNMEGFIRILDMIKTQFKTVLLVSHLDSLKDTVDTQIMIEKKKGYAFVKQ